MLLILYAVVWVRRDKEVVMKGESETMRWVTLQDLEMEIGKKNRGGTVGRWTYI